MTKTITIRTRNTNADAVEKGLLGGSEGSSLTQVDLSTLRANLDNVCKNLSELLDFEDAPSGYRLREFHVGVEISAEGGINLIGSLSAAERAAVTLTFTNEP